MRLKPGWSYAYNQRKKVSKIGFPMREGPRAIERGWPIGGVWVGRSINFGQGIIQILSPVHRAG